MLWFYRKSPRFYFSMRGFTRFIPNLYKVIPIGFSVEKNIALSKSGVRR